MLRFDRMITGFNTDVRHDGNLYHVQTEDRGKDNPVFESLIYIGGTVVAQKLTPYTDRLIEGANEQAIASLLKRQHQVIIAAIKAGRIKDLIRLSHVDQAVDQIPAPDQTSEASPDPLPEIPKATAEPEPAVAAAQSGNVAVPKTERRRSGPLKLGATGSSGQGDTSGLNLDQ